MLPVKYSGVAVVFFGDENDNLLTLINDWCAIRQDLLRKERFLDRLDKLSNFLCLTLCLKFML